MLVPKGQWSEGQSVVLDTTDGGDLDEGALDLRHPTFPFDLVAGEGRTREPRHPLQ
jgi:hypothetical protein